MTRCNGHKIKVLHCLIDQNLTKAVARMDLTGTQGFILRHIALHADNPVCARDIETRFDLSHATVSGILCRLEGKEFISIVPDASDRRIKRLVLLPKGRDCMDQTRKAIETMERQLIRDFDPEEQAAFSSLLDRAIRNLGGEIHRPPEMEETSC